MPAIPVGAETTPPPGAAGEKSVEEEFESIPYTITIKASSTGLPWFDPAREEARYDSLEAAAAAGVWNYPAPGPTQMLQESRCRVFEELWRKGHYLGGGLRFGGDFLVYPGQSCPFRHRPPRKENADTSSRQATHCGTTRTSP